MKFKTLVLMVVSAIGFNVNALDLSHHYEYEIRNADNPTIFNNGYYSNYSGGVYKDTGLSFELLYKLDNAVLIDTNGKEAIGHYKTNFISGPNIGNYFICPIETCDVVSSRRTINRNNVFILNTPGSSMATQSSFSGYGNAIIKGQNVANEDFKVTVIDLLGNVLDSFEVISKVGGIFSEGRQLIATTGITQEKNFKLLTSSHGEYKVKLKQWNSISESIDDLPILLPNGEGLNSQYPNGLAPIAIGNPRVNETGDIVYRMVVAILNGVVDAPTSNKILWGDVRIDNGKAVFIDAIKIVNSDFSSINFATQRIFLSDDNTLFMGNKKLVMRNSSSNFEDIVISLENRDFNQFIYYRSSNGSVVVYDKIEPKGYKIFSPSKFILEANSLNVDPYLNSEMRLKLYSENPNYYGIEASCTLQITNATVDSNDYTPLSETALQIPIEWDSLTGEWKGAQSLTGLESLSGSKEFAKFDLTADVTTGTWTMNCSGIASDIEGNKIALNPAEITINLDDQIHGGANVISGKISIPNTSDYSGVVVTITLNGRQIEVTTQEDGTFEFDRLVAGDYSVHVYSDQYVAACTSLTLNTDNTNPVLNIPMYAGDINNDGGVDIGDFSLLSSLFGLNSDDENYNPLADLNHDNVINVQDLSILGSHFGTDHCEVSPQ